MKYSVDPWVFDKNPDVCFGIIIGKGIKNSLTTEADANCLMQSEEHLKNILTVENLKKHPDIAVYRDALRNVKINPNKFMNSVEAMCKRVVKGGSLPRINAMVDLCNAISLKEVISLGAHDLADIKYDLEVRPSKEGDKFLPFGGNEFEDVPLGELVFTSGNEIQTRQWLWRQSELGKITETSTDIIFQLVGFKGYHQMKFENAMKAVEELVQNRFNGITKLFLVDSEYTTIEF
ncbi:MAG: phenylalanine--tRNA ligase beta subunit-related protein [Marinisporobacter sp.]|jgi:DNA/RNA-binding domain of Phe-tRNA-synthetase-like protein|nr:phenylalanine--tRNA ligase beta subunit-related protein [Marinisporobacter sp.]